MRIVGYDSVKTVSFAGALAVGLGGIIGAGIFVLSGTMISLSGTGALIAFIMTGFVAVILALEMGELVSTMPNSTGASYSFVYDAFGSELGFITGISLYLSFTASVSAIALGFGTYLASMAGISSTLYSHIFAVVLIVVLIGINLEGVAEAAKADLLIVAFKVAVLIVFIAFALLFGKFLSSNISMPAFNGVSGIFAASVIAMFAYAGFQSIATMAPNIKGGGKTAARAILVAVAISLVLYVMVTLALLSLLPGTSFGQVADPLSFALKSASAPTWLFYLVDFAALAATTSATLAMMIAGSQLVFQLSSDGLLPKYFSRTGKSRKAPITSVLLTAFFGIALMFTGNIYIIAAISNFGILFSYLISGFALIKIRRARRRPERHSEFIANAGLVVKDVFEMPLFPFLPIAGIVMIIAFFFGFPPIALSAGIGLVLACIIVYYALREDRDEPVIKIRFFK